MSSPTASQDSPTASSPIDHADLLARLNAPPTSPPASPPTEITVTLTIHLPRADSPLLPISYWRIIPTPGPSPYFTPHFFPNTHFALPLTAQSILDTTRTLLRTTSADPPLPVPRNWDILGNKARLVFEGDLQGDGRAWSLDDVQNLRLAGLAGVVVFVRSWEKWPGDDRRDTVGWRSGGRGARRDTERDAAGREVGRGERARAEGNGWVWGTYEFR